MVLRKMRLGYVSMSAYNFVGSGPNFTIFFCSTQKNCFCERRLNVVAIFINFKDICGQTRKLS